MIAFMIVQLKDEGAAEFAEFHRDSHNEYALPNLCWLIWLHLVNLRLILSEDTDGLSKQQ